MSLISFFSFLWCECECLLVSKSVGREYKGSSRSSRSRTWDRDSPERKVSRSLRKQVRSKTKRRPSKSRAKRCLTAGSFLLVFQWSETGGGNTRKESRHRTLITETTDEQERCRLCHGLCVKSVPRQDRSAVIGDYRTLTHGLDEPGLDIGLIGKSIH